MSKKGTIHRYTLIIDKIGNRQHPSFVEIQDYLNDHGFEVSKRTIERDFEAIRNEFGVEITYNRIKRGYFIDEDNSIDLPSFLRFLEIVNTAELLTDSLQESKETLNYISFDQAGGLRGIELLHPLLKAIKNQLKIKFVHQGFYKEASRKYSFKPYLLKEFQNRWYVCGVVSGLNEVRTFGIDRITELQLSDTTFVRDVKLTIQERFDDIIGVINDEGMKESVVLSFTPFQGKYVKSLPMHHSQQILLDDATECRIELKLIPNYELKQQILMHHAHVKVLKPTWLVEEVKEMLVNALRGYTLEA